MKKILFVCVENSGRSQMAEAFANHYGKGKIEATSAGTRPANSVNPTVVEALREKGIDISRNKPKLIDQDEAKKADMVITMGCYEAEGICPAPLFRDVTDWNIEDPKGKSIEEVQRIRDQIERRVKELVSQVE
jgi:arsenate reductase (thioredoxin)